MNTVLVLGSINNPRIVDALFYCLKDENSNVQYYAIEMLAKIRDFRAIEPLMDKLRDANWNIRIHAAWALEQITGETFGLNYLKWQKWWEQNK